MAVVTDKVFVYQSLHQVYSVPLRVELIVLYIQLQPTQLLPSNQIGGRRPSQHCRRTCSQ